MRSRSARRVLTDAGSSEALLRGAAAQVEADEQHQGDHQAGDGVADQAAAGRWRGVEGRLEGGHRRESSALSSRRRRVQNKSSRTPKAGKLDVRPLLF